MKKDNYDSVVKCRIEKVARDKFNEACKEQDVNASEVLRIFIYEFIAKHLK